VTPDDMLAQVSGDTEPLRLYIKAQQRAFEALRADLHRVQATAATYRVYFEMKSKRCRNQRQELRRFNSILRLAHKLKDLPGKTDNQPTKGPAT
jgi:hypothetical protein